MIRKSSCRSDTSRRIKLFIRRWDELRLKIRFRSIKRLKCVTGAAADRWRRAADVSGNWWFKKLRNETREKAKRSETFNEIRDDLRAGNSSSDRSGFRLAYHTNQHSIAIGGVYHWKAYEYTSCRTVHCPDQGLKLTNWGIEHVSFHCAQL